MNRERHLMGLYSDERQAAAAVRSLAQSPFKVLRVHSPIPSHRLAEALQVKKSRVGLFTLIGGVIGFFAGFTLAIFTALRWHLIVGGKPVMALVPFVIVGFEFTILFAVFGNIIGFLFQTDLPRFDLPEHYDARCSGDHFGVLATCEDGQQDQLSRLLTRQGGQVSALDPGGI